MADTKAENHGVSPEYRKPEERRALEIIIGIKDASQQEDTPLILKAKEFRSQIESLLQK